MTTKLSVKTRVLCFVSFAYYKRIILLLTVLGLPFWTLGQTVLFEDFSTYGTLPGSLPFGWSTNLLTDFDGFSQGDAFKIYDSYTANTNGRWPVPARTPGNRFAGANDTDFPCDCNHSNSYLESPYLNLVGIANPTLTFWIFHEDYLVSSTAFVSVSTDGGISWVDLIYYPTASSLLPVNASDWKIVAFDLSAYTNSSSLKIRINWNDNFAWTSGFAVDDVHVGSRANFSLTNERLNTGNQDAGEFNEDWWSYTMIPLSQVANVNASSMVYNTGLTDQEYVYMTLEITKNDFSQGVWSSANIPPLPPLTKDYATISTTYIPDEFGTYELTSSVFSASGDENPYDNIQRTSFKVTECTYALDTGEPVGAFVLNAGEEAGNIFHIYQDEYFYGIQASLFLGTNPGSNLRGKVYELANFNPSTLDLDFFPVPNSTTNELTISNADITETNNLNLICLNFQQPLLLEANKTYFIGVEYDDTLYIAISGAHDTESSIIYADAANYYSDFNRSMVIRLKGACSNPCAIEVFSNCTNPTACNYDPTANWDNGSCILVGDPCDDQDSCTENDILSNDCVCIGTLIDSNFNGICDYNETLLQVIAQDVTLDCFDNLSSLNYLVTVYGACNPNYSITYYDDYNTDFPDPCNSVITRYWTVEDACGNTGYAVSTITIYDNYGPIFTSIPGFVYVECSESLPFVYPQAYDECSFNVNYTFQDDTVYSNTCPHEYTLFRTFTAYDDCGNTTSATSEFYFIDSTPPVFEPGTPQFYTIEYGSNFTLPTPVAYDNCSANVQIFLEQSVDVSTLCGLNYLTWIAVDECGNIATLNQTINIIHTSPTGTSPCNDYDPCTINDVIGADCICQGTPVGCNSVNITQTNCINEFESGHSVSGYVQLTSPIQNGQLVITNTCTYDQIILNGPFNTIIPFVFTNLPYSSAPCTITAELSNGEGITAAQYTTPYCCATQFSYYTGFQNHSFCLNETAEPIGSILAGSPLGASNNTYQWFIQNGQSTIPIPGATDSLFVPATNAIGTYVYSCQVTDNFGCFVAGPQHNVTIINGSEFIGSFDDHTICQGYEVALTPNINYYGGNYLWSNGSTNAVQTLQPSVSETLSVQYTIGTCVDFRDTINILVRPFPTVSLEEQTICSGESVTLTAIVDGQSANSGGSFQWSDNSTSQSITISPSQTSLYSVSYTPDGCQVEQDCIDPALINYCESQPLYICSICLFNNPGCSCNNELFNTGSLPLYCSGYYMYSPMDCLPPEATSSFASTLVNVTTNCGCTDPLASNYNPNATTDDGSCIYSNCDNLDIYVAQQPCQYTDNGDLLPTARVYFFYSGACVVDSIYIFDSVNDTLYGFNVYGTNGDYQFFTGFNTFTNYEVYYVLNNGSSSPSYSFYVTDCSNDPTICDCDQNIHTIGAYSWLGDGIADNGTFFWQGEPVNFNCATWGYDCGDIIGSPSSDPYGVCSGNLPPNNGCIGTLTITAWDITVECEGELVNGNYPISVAGSCSQTYSISYSDASTGCCPNACNYSFLRTWTVTDQCGNQASANSTITVIDNVPPQFAFMPSDDSLNCDEQIPEFTPVVYDNCSNAQWTVSTITIPSGICAYWYDVLKIYVATDQCGNSLTDTVRYYIRDYTSPIFSSGVMNYTIFYGEQFTPPTPVAFDNCSNVIISSYQETYPADACGSYAIIWTARDNCNNQTSITQQINVILNPLGAPIPCDDSNPCTINDVINEDCLCQGIYNCCQLPVITQQPIENNATCQFSNNTVLYVFATGSNLTYQWYESQGFNSILIPGATSSAFAPPTSSVGVKFYYCIVSSGIECSVQSYTCRFEVTNAAVFEGQLDDITICPNYEVNITPLINAYGGTYTWTLIGGNSTVNTPILHLSPSQTVSYSLLYTIGDCVSYSDIVTVTVDNPADVTVNSAVICPGQSAVLTAVPDHPGGTFLWSTGQSGQSIVVSPSTSTNYSVSYSYFGCDVLGQSCNNEALYQLAMNTFSNLVATQYCTPFFGCDCNGAFLDGCLESINFIPVYTSLDCQIALSNVATVNSNVTVSSSCNEISILSSGCDGALFYLNGVISISNPPASGTLTLTSSCGFSQVFSAPFSNNIPFSFQQNGTTFPYLCTIEASFSSPNGPSIASTEFILNACCSDTPAFVFQEVPSNIVTCQNSATTPIEVIVNGYPYTVQWLSSDNLNGPFVLENSSQSTTFNPPTNVVGTKYYLCQVYNSGCYSNLIYEGICEYTVLPANLTPTFGAFGPYCAGSNIAALPTTSTNGVQGNWSPAINNQTTTTYTFTPNAGQCASNVTATIVITPATTPSFGTFGSYCTGSTIPALPTTSLNGIQGNWSPAINNQTTTTYTFTPNSGQCASSATQTIQITQSIIPSFNIVGEYCAGSAIPALPTTSTNGVQGNWSPAINNQTTTTYTFTPNSGQCASSASQTIQITQSIIPSFNIVGEYCAGSAIPALPTTSNNGVQGNWSPAINNQTTTAYVFTPAAGQCATLATQTISIGAAVNAQITNLDNTTVLSCTQSDITLFASGATNIAWSGGLGNNALAIVTTPGTYTVSVSDNLGCSDQASITITQINDAPTATITNNSGTNELNCNTPSIILTASGGGTYSWNNGLGTSANATVTQPGTYTVTVTQGGCSDTESIVVTEGTTTLNPQITASSTILCPYETVVLTASDGDAYQWSDGSTGSSLTVNAAGSYSVTATNAAGCSGTSSVVNIIAGSAPNATIVANGPTSVCAGQSVTLSAGSVGTAYLWSTGETTQSITSDAIGDYWLVLTNASGCRDTSETVTIDNDNGAGTVITPSAGAIINAQGQLILCEGQELTLTATPENQVYLWSTGVTSQSIVVQEAGVYSVTSINPGGCPGEATLTVISSSYPNACTFADITACGSIANEFTFCAPDADNFAWTNSVAPQFSNANQCITVSPSVTTTYYLSMSNNEACTTNCEVTIIIGSTCFRDNDGDTFGNINEVSEFNSCDCPPGWVTIPYDCDDNNPDVNEYLSEICYDSIDNDCDFDVDEDCDPIIFGCTYADACNYDSLATEDDGSCVFSYGCIDPTACNFNSAACFDNGACVYPEGCNDPLACNYDADADCPDPSSCVYIQWGEIEGETEPMAGGTNYPYTYSIDCDPSCTYTWGVSDFIGTTIDAGDIISGVADCPTSFANFNDPIMIDNTFIDTAYVTLNITCGNGCSHTIELPVEVQPNSITELSALSLLAYPNPTTSDFVLEITSEARGGLLEVYDAIGRVVHTEKLMQLQKQIDSDRWAAGVYTLRLMKDNQGATLRVIKE